jgi:hypothetical protein
VHVRTSHADVFERRGFEVARLPRVKAVATRVSVKGKSGSIVATHAPCTPAVGVGRRDEDLLAALFLRRVVRETGADAPLWGLWVEDLCHARVELAVYRNHAPLELREGALYSVFRDVAVSVGPREQFGVVGERGHLAK